jgi:hypothetical protein
VVIVAVMKPMVNMETGCSMVILGRKLVANILWKKVLKEIADNLYRKVHALEDMIYNNQDEWSIEEIDYLGKIIEWRKKHGWAEWEKKGYSPEEREREMLKAQKVNSYRQGKSA